VRVAVLCSFAERLMGCGHTAAQAGNAIASLKKSLKPEATVKRNGLAQCINAAEVVPGDIVLLGAGQAVPADCRLLAGKPIQVDQAALTGESLPVTMTEGSPALMGSTVTRGEIEAVVTATGSGTFFGKTATLISNVDEMAHFEKVFQQINLSLTTLGVTIVTITFIMLVMVRNRSLRTPMIVLTGCTAFTWAPAASAFASEADAARWAGCVVGSAGRTC
jgi:P-type E1-E2 ATPase